MALGGDLHEFRINKDIINFILVKSHAGMVSVFEHDSQRAISVCIYSEAISRNIKLGHSKVNNVFGGKSWLFYFWGEQIMMVLKIKWC